MYASDTATTDSIIVECCAPIFSMTGQLSDPDQVPDNFREEVDEAFLAMERKAFEKQLHPTLVRDIKYAMAAYTDEMVMGSGWPNKTAWVMRPLCVEFFGDSNAGEGFFTRLEVLQQDPAKHFLVLEHYYTCLQLGFQGVYKLHGLERLQALQSTLREKLDERRGPVERTLANSAAPESKLVYRISGRQPYWVMAAISAALVVVMLTIYSSNTRSAIAESAEAIQALQDSLQLQPPRTATPINIPGYMPSYIPSEVRENDAQ